MTVTRTTTRRAAAALAAVLSSAMALTGCLYLAIPEEATTVSPTPEPAPLPDVTGWSADDFYDQEIAWSDCGSPFECTTVVAPLDWHDPEAGSIELALIRQTALGGTAIGSLLTNPGGPGASGVELIELSIDYAVGTPLQEQFDVIGFDPRGVGRSTAVHCLDDAEMDAYLYDIVPAERGSAEWEAELNERNQRFAEACEAGSDGILEFITTEQSARDMDLLRALLGDEQLNYLGYSYGTFLGATYAELFPENVGRLVLDGAIDPSTSGPEVSAIQAVGFEQALRAFMADCLESSECPFRGSVDQAMADLATLLASVDASPLPTADGRQLGADSLLTGIIAALYSQDSWPFLESALASALSGDGETAMYLADFYNGRENGAYLDNSTEAFRAYNCMDYPADTDQARIDAADARIAAEAPTVAPYWDGPDACAAWPFPPSGSRGAITAEGAAPIVVVGTTGDPATPYEWSVALAEQLASGVLVTNTGEGHTGYNKGNVCVDTAVESYLLTGEVPADNACS